MIISEKQLMALIDIARQYLVITTNNFNEEVIRDLLTDINEQQSEELKEVK